MAPLLVTRDLYPHERARPSRQPAIAPVPKPPGSFLAAAVCCCVLSFTPLILFVAFLLMEPMPEDATLPRAPIPGFARHKNANCDYATQAAMTTASSTVSSQLGPDSCRPTVGLARNAGCFEASPACVV